jgi:hypothetical protein
VTSRCVPHIFCTKKCCTMAVFLTSVALMTDVQRLIPDLSFIHVTAYSTVTQSRSFLPDVVGAVTWIAPYAPHHSSFVPVYASAPVTPSSLNTGTQCKALTQMSNCTLTQMHVALCRSSGAYSVELIQYTNESLTMLSSSPLISFSPITSSRR